MSIDIRPIYALSDMYRAVELQKTYWGNDLESVVPAHMLFSIANAGGHVLVAMVDGVMAGVLVGFIGTDIEYERPAAANLQMVSKRMVVLPEYRNRGLAYALKVHQRDLTMRQAIRLVTWTFDPLLAPNAHLNIRKLGAICPEFRENYYGTDSTGGLAALGYSDRLVVEWWVTHRRVKARLDSSRGDLTLQQYLQANTPILNPTQLTSDGVLRPAENASLPSGSMALLEIPLDYSRMVGGNEALALAWREHARTMFKAVMSMGYIVTDFVRDQLEGRERAFYLFSHGSPQFFDTSLN